MDPKCVYVYVWRINRRFVTHTTWLQTIYGHIIHNPLLRQRGLNGSLISIITLSVQAFPIKRETSSEGGTGPG
jgi:hypothetical protein